MQSEQLRVVDAHPDPDLLTAFAEQSLTQRERQLVLAHLATCAECREVITLAGSATLEPELAAAAVGRPSSAKTGKAFWSWRPLRWTAAAATAAVVLSAVWLNRSERESLTQTQATPVAQAGQKNPAPSETAADQLISTSELPAGPQTVEKIPASNTTPVVRDDEQLRRKRAEPVPPRPVAPSQEVGVNAPTATVPTENKQEALDLVEGKGTRELATSGRSFAQLTQLQPGLAKAQAGAAPKASVGGTISLGNVAAPAKEEAASEKDKKSGTLAAQVAPAAIAPQSAPQSAMSYSRKPAEDLAPASPIAEGNLKQNATIPKDEQASASTPKLQKMASGQNAESDMPARSSLSDSVVIVNPWWRVTKQGQLEKSFDSGRTWQTVFDENIAKFRAVASLDAVVWAGGDSGDFWSSTNGGKTWRRGVPNVDGHSPKGQVTKIALPNPATVIITTDAGETWTSTNGGLNWTVKYE
jgi:Putative zinc-finger